MTTPRDPRPSGTEDDDLLRAVLEEEAVPDDRPDRRDPVSPTARQRLRAGAGAPPSARRPSVEEVYGPVPTSPASSSAPPAAEPSAPAAGTSAMAPDPSSQVFIGADAEPPTAAPSRRRSRRVPAPGGPVTPVQDQTDPLAVPESVQPGPIEVPAPIAAPESSAAEGSADAAPIHVEERHEALSDGLRRTGPDSEEIRRVEAQSPWGRLRSPQTGSTPLLAPPEVPRSAEAGDAPGRPTAGDRPWTQSGPSTAGTLVGGPLMSASPSAASGAPRETERGRLPWGALLSLLVLVVVLVVLAILFL